jgi:hypothetical protein
VATPFCGGGSKYFGCVEIARPTRKTRCEIRSTSRASPRSAQDDARGRTAYISTAFLSIHKKSAEKASSLPIVFYLQIFL